MVKLMGFGCVCEECEVYEDGEELNRNWIFLYNLWCFQIYYIFWDWIAKSW